MKKDIAFILALVVLSGAVIALAININSLQEDINNELITSQEINLQARTQMQEDMVDGMQFLENQIIQQLSESQREQAILFQRISSLEAALEQEEERSTQLQELIQNIQIESQDFQQVITQVTGSVVSVQTMFGQGSGVVIDPNTVVTNRHVIDGAANIRIIDTQQRIYRPELTIVSQRADLAVLFFEELPLKPLTSAEAPPAGAPVIAVGNPYGLSSTVTEGIISARERIIDQSGISYIQTDVPINAGNSGGALINLRGEVVGINTLRITGSDGLGFAIPMDEVHEFVEEAENSFRSE